MKKYIIWLIILLLSELVLAVYLTSWRHTFWDYVAARNLKAFITQLGIFTVVACIICITDTWIDYLKAILSIKWRQKLNSIAHKLHLDSRIENIGQRIQNDCRDYPTLMVDLMFGLTKSIIYVIAFSIAMVLQFSYLYLVVVIIFSALSTIAAKFIGNPLIKLNYACQKVEATYRNNINKSNFMMCVINMTALAKKAKHLSYFQVLYGQIGSILPLAIAAPSYFSGAISLGGLMQVNSMMGTIVDNMGYVINYFGNITKLLSVRRRLLEIGVL